MRFNGKDLGEIHRAVSRSREFPPGMPAREITISETGNGGIVANVVTKPDEYVVRVNIAAKNYEEAEEAREAIAAWALSSGKQTGMLEPKWAKGKAYDAIAKSISRAEKRFTTVDVTFTLPEPTMYTIEESVQQAEGMTLTANVGGTAPTEPVLEISPAEDCEDLYIVVNGEMYCVLKGAFTAHHIITIDTKTGEIMLDYQHIEERIAYAWCSMETEFVPGENVIGINTTGTIKARWHDRWL